MFISLMFINKYLTLYIEVIVRIELIPLFIEYHYQETQKHSLQNFIKKSNGFVHIAYDTI